LGRGSRPSRKGMKCSVWSHARMISWPFKLCRFWLGIQPKYDHEGVSHRDLDALLAFASRNFARKPGS
jgi:hypothetical protein